MSNVNQSSIYRTGATAQTESVMSTRFKIYAPIVGQGKFKLVGVTSSFSVSESRNVEAIRALGFGDQVAELVPGVTEPMTLQVTRTALYLANIYQMFGYKAGVSGAVRSLKHHKWPFDIKTEIVFSELASTDTGVDEATVASVNAEGGLNNIGNPGLFAVSTIFEGCWINSYSSSFNTGQTAVSEDVGIMVTDVFDTSGSIYGMFIDSGNSPTDITGASLLYAQNNINS